MTERRTQADRRAATRTLLVDAAIGSLIERGWAATTSVEVCARAGVTRGAFVHHFESMPELLAAALQAIYDDSTASRKTGAPKTLADAIDRTWLVLSEPRFKAVIEAWLAMTNDPVLANDLGPVVAAFAARMNPEGTKAQVLRTAERRAYYLMARESMLGLALGRATNGGRPLGHEAAVLKTLRRGAEELERD